MPYKFKVGDRVKVVRRLTFTPHSIRQLVGSIGIVNECRKDGKFDLLPYCVYFTQLSMWFNVRELEATPAKKKRAKKKGK